MTVQVKKAGRKSNAEKAAIAAASENLELAKIEGDKIIDLEPVSKAPVTLSVDEFGEDLGDVTNVPVKAPENASTELPEPSVTNVLSEDLKDILSNPSLESEITKEINKELIKEILNQSNELSKFEYHLEDGFKPTLLPTMVGHELVGYISCPRAVFELVQTIGWQAKIDSTPVHVQAGLKSVLYWKNKNGKAIIRCHSSSKFGEAV